MKNYNEINGSVANLEQTKAHFQWMSCLFYTRLLNQLEDTMQIPSTHLIKYEHKDNESAESLDDCVGIEDIYAVAKVGIVFQDKLIHLITFKNCKTGPHTLTLTVECRNEQDQFEFDIQDDEQICQLDFSEVISLISKSIDKYYNQWTERFSLQTMQSRAKVA